MCNYQQLSAVQHRSPCTVADHHSLGSNIQQVTSPGSLALVLGQPSTHICMHVCVCVYVQQQLSVGLSDPVHVRNSITARPVHAYTEALSHQPPQCTLMCMESQLQDSHSYP